MQRKSGWQRWLWGWAIAFLLAAGAGTAEAAGWQPPLRVGLLQHQQSVTLELNQEGLVQAGKKSVKVSAGRPVEISLKNGSFVVNGKSLSGERLEIKGKDAKHQDSLQVKVNRQGYRGGIELIRGNGAFTVVNLVLAEQYLWGVVPEEMPTDWPEEALKAQAVAARTFALKNRKHHEAEGFDLCTTTHCQVYEGIAGEAPKASAAIDATKGEVLWGKDSLIDALFHTDSGGMTENCEEVWGSDSPYLRAAKERQMNTQPWEKTFTAEEFGQKLHIGKLKRVELSSLHVGRKDKDRTTSGRVKSLRAIGSNGTKEVTGNDMRSIFGLKSTLFEVKMAKGRVVISGFGWGHGLGMSQWGARAYATEMKYAEILSHYYKNTVIKKLY